MKIKNIKRTRGSIIVEIDDKVVHISGELTLEPKFYADLESITNWEKPHENVIISEEEKQIIALAIENETNNSKAPIVFE